MGFNKLKNLKTDYNTLDDDIIHDFYIPCLSEAVEYKRSVGFFSSTILLAFSYGLGKFVENGGKIKLIVSPNLEPKDFDAIKEGYSMKEIVEKKIIDSYDEDVEFEQKEDRFSLLSYLISKNILDIKIAVLNADNIASMYHEKIGIMIDEDDEIISFNGSNNETINGAVYNAESFDVYCSWKSEDQSNRCESKTYRFDLLWHNEQKGVTVIPFPTVIKEKILKHNNYDIDFVKLDLDAKKRFEKKKSDLREPSLDNCNLFDYQINAIEKWKENNYRGIFDMATGTGKTFTGIGAICTLFKEKGRLISVICCPYQHLVDQWAEEVRSFNIEPIKCYSGLKYKDKLKRELRKFLRKKVNYVCVIIVNATFRNAEIQELIKRNLEHTILVADEAHNLGAKTTLELLKVNYPYRLGLSATLDRYGDEAGTKELYDFFDKKVFSYSLEEAIQNDKLTKYKYYVHFAILEEEEYEEYLQLSEKIRAYHVDRTKELPRALKMLLIKRSRIIAGAKDKIRVLKELLKGKKNENNLLVYCGAVSYSSEDNFDDSDNIRQIDIIHEMLNKELDITSATFTSRESAEERRLIIESYKDNDVQCLVAIKCLDEGVNVPSIKTAYILASSNNPKEYIQRRGRVLRRYPGKECAEIHDFVTLPTRLEETDSYNFSKIAMDLPLIKKELTRIEYFQKEALNYAEIQNVVDEMRSVYMLDTFIIDEEMFLYE